MQILITGMHRSGTSVIARLLAECGCFIGRPEDLMPPKPDNPEGFWEHLDSYDINVEILEAAGGAWDTATGGEIEVLSHADRSKAGARIHEFVSSMSSHDVWAVKDPRLALTYPLWRPLLSDPIVVWCVRNPIEIGVSLKGRNGFPVDLGIALWEAYTVEAMKNIHGIPVVVASYNDLLRDPVSEVRRLVESINEVGREEIRVPDQTAIEPIVRLGLHRSAVSPDKEDHFFTEHRRRLMALSRSADGWSGRGRDVDLSELSRDEILGHRQMLKLENQPVLVPEALVNEALGRVEAQSAERSADLDGRLAELSQRCDTILETADVRLGTSGEEVVKLQARIGETSESSIEMLARLETRLADISDSSRDAFASMEGQLAETSDSSRGALERVETRLADMSDSSKSDLSRLETRLAETSESSIEMLARLETRLADMSDSSKSDLSRLETRFADMSDSSRGALERLETRLAETSDSSRGALARLETRLTDMSDSTKGEVVRLEAGLNDLANSSEKETATLKSWLEDRDEAARAERAELKQWLSKLAEERSGLSAELDKKDRELELVRTELDRHQTALAGYRSSLGGRVLDRWWRLRSKG